ncbi:MAG TPA: 1-deoxy-D-xylulose-5-phosphate synthase [Spirochaetota bacterium]|nr:1-deoxy-D-xylulose-5-phosphate synthase [Spirochaetota bacterium]HOL56551.1 1-deoxy-D-xylulose-5-phosphate synthase [Spirochaetota bacterium]HPP03986.1 1-deoxy-D-xylulose-5-phosphate synthase [Spirochaetota bacterium]
MLENIKSLDDLKKIPLKDLSKLAEEIREKIISVVSLNGGHLASNLGSVELIIALHYVFNMPEDKIIFDVGHQSYTHKILTGRLSQIDTLRIKNGLSGFTRRRESIYDLVDSGHSSTSISQACGFTIADKFQNKNGHTIVVIGDGALTGGVAYEGLNFAGHKELPLLVILNDNEMSIGKNVGAISKHIAKLTLTKPYQILTDLYIKAVTKKKGVIKFLFWFAKKFEKALKIYFDFENIFTNMGFDYIGPIDGHNINDLIDIFTKIKYNVKRPILLHIKTIKGKGLNEAEDDPCKFHGISPCITDKDSYKKYKTFTDVFSEEIVKLGEKYSDIIAITAAMEDGTGLKEFKNRFPDRFFDVGIAEQHAVTFSSTLAYSGLRPVFAVYSTFLARAVDMVIQDIAISKAPVIFAIDRAGIVGEDGETHQGQFDITFLKMIPNITIMAPADGEELKLMLNYAYKLNRPVAIRYPKDIAYSSLKSHPDIENNPFIVIREGREKLVIVIGNFIDDANEAINQLNMDYGLIYLRILKPLPYDSLLEEIKKYNKILIIEENVRSGSVTEEIACLLLKNSIFIKLDSINLPDKFIEHDKKKNILNELGFCIEGIKKKLTAL